MTDRDRAPIFILGITQRSGTNFLHDLIATHPDCAGHPTVWEDFLVERADLLERYAANLHRHWEWKTRESGIAPAEVTALLGSALVERLARDVPDRRLVTKTPSVRGLASFRSLFPDAPLLILVRDGRAVVESRVKTFDETYARATARWAEAARTILEFRARKDDAFRIVRYEDLWSEPERTLRDLFGFLRLDPDRYDYAKAANLPVRGSSTLSDTGVHWEPVERSASFDPTKRFRHWGRGLHEQFHRLAGDELDALGYARERFEGGEALWSVWTATLGVRRALGRAVDVTTAPVRAVVKGVIGRERAAELRRRWESRRRGR